MSEQLLRRLEEALGVAGPKRRPEDLSDDQLIAAMYACLDRSKARRPRPGPYADLSDEEVREQLKALSLKLGRPWPPRLEDWPDIHPRSFT